MVKQIVRDIFFLSQPSEPATKADIQIGKDLQDTLQANREPVSYTHLDILHPVRYVAYADIRRKSWHYQNGYT